VSPELAEESQEVVDQRAYFFRLSRRRSRVRVPSTPPFFPNAPYGTTHAVSPLSFPYVIARANHLSLSASNRLLAVLNVAMADTVFTTWSAKRFYASVPTEVTWRPVTAIPLADTDDNPDTQPDTEWVPLMNTPSHPEYPAGHPSLNGAGAAVLLRHFHDAQTFILTTAGQPSRTYASISQARADGNNARVWGGMHFPSTVRISDAEGAAIAAYVDEQFMPRRHGGHGPSGPR
jgi:hypothetical protein